MHRPKQQGRPGQGRPCVVFDAILQGDEQNIEAGNTKARHIGRALV